MVVDELFEGRFVGAVLARRRRGTRFAERPVSGDTGVSSFMFGTFLSWFNDYESEVFVVCTANDVSRLPPEFGHSERFDGNFFLDLPGRSEKEAIWRIYREQFEISVDQREPDDSQWTGAEIRACCRLAALLDVPLSQAAQNVVPVLDLGCSTVLEEFNPVPGGSDGWQVEHGFGADQCPTPSTTFYWVFYQVATIALNEAGWDEITGLLMMVVIHASHVSLQIVQNSRHGAACFSDLLGKVNRQMFAAWNWTWRSFRRSGHADRRSSRPSGVTNADPTSPVPRRRNAASLPSFPSCSHGSNMTRPISYSDLPCVADWIAKCLGASARSAIT